MNSEFIARDWDLTPPTHQHGIRSEVGDDGDAYCMTDVVPWLPSLSQRMVPGTRKSPDHSYLLPGLP